jgi:hypothetical protein
LNEDVSDEGVLAPPLKSRHRLRAMGAGQKGHREWKTEAAKRAANPVRDFDKVTRSPSPT